MRARAGFAAAALWCAATAVLAQSCPLPGPATPAPAWVSGAGAEDAGALFAAGVAELKRDTPLDSARDAARTRAIAELAQQVQADVRTRISDTLEKVTQDGKSRSSETFTSTADVQSRLALRSVQVAEQWADVAGCRLWVRVRMPREDAERARRAATSDAAVATTRERLKAAADATLPLAQRQAALAEAQEVAKLADPALSSGYSRDAFELQRVELATTLGAQRQREDGYREGLTQHVQAMARAGGASTAADKRTAQQQALQTLEKALALAPQGIAGFTLPFVPAERLATLYAELGMACSGRQAFERRNQPVPAALAGATCDGKAIAREKRLQYLGGKSLQIDCSLQLAGKREAWPKACGTLQTQFAAEGAVPPAAKAAPQIKVELRAEGEVEERKDAETGRASWRFRGKIRSLVRGPEALEIVDDYEGLTGWNPVSGSMAADLLALAVTRRLDAALTAFWEK